MMEDTDTSNNPISSETSPVSLSTTTEAQPAPWKPRDLKEALPEDLRTHESLSKYKTDEDAFRALLAAQKFIGARPDELIKRPKGDDPVALRSTFQALGLPDHVDAYHLPPDAKKAFENDPSTEAFRQAAFEVGVLPSQFAQLHSKMVEYFAGIDKQNQESTARQDAENLAKLKESLGSAFDVIAKQATMVADKFGVTEALTEAGLGSHPGVVQLLAAAFPLLSEDSTGTGVAFVDPKMSVGTPQGYAAKADELTRQAIATKDYRLQRELAAEAYRYRELATRGK